MDAIAASDYAGGETHMVRISGRALKAIQEQAESQETHIDEELERIVWEALANRVLEANVLGHQELSEYSQDQLIEFYNKNFNSIDCPSQP